MSHHALITDLLRSSALSAETKEELKGYERELAGGALDPADAAYIEALHRRLIGGKPGRAEAAAEALPDEEPELEEEDLLTLVRRSFDELYHPEHGRSEAGDKASRDAIHAEFSALLRQIADRA